ncbi:hypothetical protein EYZ11_005905 [Aspergillus tanneri]|uniref:Uncharacterized protein n=1 Tax=Aspergillus tanneri TaxID=1220188 RepID=A0A4S3JJ49_9EURO|nr:uncharacterized protein ATNIH1004_008451 [Aspergillus tanneri]KAA8644252.1 hypothetical protein ATNIH1004_008451 [Aspergillus tanneri]THC94617.1 hypothetical protein EYZ11_005905 [Aspergillus tanneri]
MPTNNNTSSPVKRPGLGRRAVSSHAVVTRSSSQAADLDPNTTHQKQLPLRLYRPHVVGGHRNHHRNTSHGKNFAKFQRHSSTLHLPDTAGRHHQRKKSAPATPAASPRGQHHVHWDGAVDSHPTTASMKKNYSSPALRRNHSGVVGKKALVTVRPNSSAGKKKTVGFELADSDNDDGDWEDTTQSPESTRRSSVAQSKESEENTAVLVDPLTFVKRPYPQFPRATSLPESTSKSFGEGPLPDDDDDGGDDGDDDDAEDQDKRRPSTGSEESEDAAGRAPDQGDIANRLLTPSHSAKAPPAMSSISATAEPAAVDSLSRPTSLTNLASDGLRRPVSSSNTAAMANTPGTPAQATSSSIEGGVSRFIKAGVYPSSRTDSDPNTPSSFLPHYHPQTPPSPNRASGSKKTRTSPPIRPPGTEPPSRTQQKLWLQRTATLNTSPPDSHGVPTSVSPSTMDPNFLGTRSGASPFDANRALVNGSARAGGAVHDNETKHIRKAYEKTSLELTVVRRFQSPTGDSFRRLNFVISGNSTGLGHERRSSLGKPIKSAPALTRLQDGKAQKPGQKGPSPEPKQLMSKRKPAMRTSVSQTYLQDPEELVNDPTEAGKQPSAQHPSYRILSTSDEAVHTNTPAAEEEEGPSYYTNESDMMIRRMWEAREVPELG